jgi:hypothetical protein
MGPGSEAGCTVDGAGAAAGFCPVIVMVSLVWPRDSLASIRNGFPASISASFFSGANPRIRYSTL